MTGILNLLLGAGGVIKDTYFNLVSLLLPGNGTNGAQNNTFLDSSTNNFTITRNGNTTQGTFSPFSQTGWGNYFNGSSALTMPNSTAFKPGSSDFNIELWYFGVATAAQQYIWGDTDSATNNGIIVLRINPTSNVAVDYFTSSTATTSRTTTGTINANAWNHICVSKTGTTLYIGINGVLETFVGPSSMQSPATVNPAIGRLGAYTASGYLTGYISNFRYVVGSALYTTNPYTVPKNNLTAISGTSLLTCQSNRFLDNSANNFTITAAGSPSVVAFSPFAPTAAYTTAAVGGSGYFDGTGDYLTAADNAALELGSGDWTLECWYYQNVTNTYSALIGKSGTSVQFASYLLQINSLTPTFYLSTSGSSYAVTISSSINITNSNWTHLAVVRNGNTITLYVNGASGGTAAYSSTPYDGSYSFAVGSYGDGSFPINGYVANARLVKGAAVYTSTFTPPTAPLTAIANTSLLLNFTNAGITDATAKNDLETVGNAQISTTQSKWGGGSIAFDGTGDYLLMPSSQLNAFGTGDFTIEMWFYLNNTSAIQALYDSRPASTDGAYSFIYVNAGGTAIIYDVSAGTRITGTATVSTSTWHHLAISRSGTSTRMFFNGTQVGTTYTDSTNYLVGTSRPAIGSSGFSLGTYPLNGYIDDLRVSRVARYTSNFTAPTAPFPVQ